MTKMSATLRRLSLVLAFIAVTGLAGCGGKKAKDDESSIPNAVGADTNGDTGDSDSGKAGGLQTVHYPYDSFNLDGNAKDALKANASILKSKSSYKIQIEGHCDRHGGIQYNIALGEKRANAAKKFLEDLGVPSERVTTVSFGKERPLDPAETEAADSKNRRANFVVTSK